MTFQEWIISIFGLSVTDRKWYELDTDFWDGPATTIVEYMTRLFAQADTILQPYSDAQVAQGLYLLISNGGTDYSFLLLDRSVPLRSRLNCIEAMATLFEHCFACRCTSHLSHLDTVDKGTPSHVSPLNGVCYMWWDILPLHGLSEHQPKHPDGPELDRVIFSVIQRCLEIDSMACQESALHGLMEWSPYYEETSEIAEGFLSRNPEICSELRAFAWRVS